MYSVHAYLFAALPLLAQCATFNVTVGGPGVLKYEPEFINAGPGDVIRFFFKQKNHTVTQSSFENPCQRVSDGFDTGFISVPDSVTGGFPVAELTVTDNSPVWAYCRQANHCKQGMVFAVNPGDKFEAFKSAAIGNLPTTSSTQPTSTSTSSSTDTSTFTPSSDNSTSSVSVVTVPVTVTTTATILPSSSSAEVSTATTTSVDHRVIVGGSESLTFDPTNIQANVGDTVTFEFRSKNHTVTQSSFSTPCEPISTRIGFDSNFLSVSANTNSFPAYSIQINDTNPIWAYCRQANHCSQGMVFAINTVENGPNNFNAFQALARTQQQSSTTESNNDSNTNTNSALQIRGVDILTLSSLIMVSTFAFLL